MKEILVTGMNWLARPFPSVNAVVLSVFASLLFLSGVAIAWHPYLTEFLEIAQAPKLRMAIRLLAFVLFSCYCTLGCLCRILIQFFPERFGQKHGKV